MALSPRIVGRFPGCAECNGRETRVMKSQFSCGTVSRSLRTLPRKISGRSVDLAHCDQLVGGLLCLGSFSSEDKFPQNEYSSTNRCQHCSGVPCEEEAER